MVYKTLHKSLKIEQHNLLGVHFSYAFLCIYLTILVSNMTSMTNDVRVV
jgi:hypothetical protein